MKLAKLLEKLEIIEHRVADADLEVERVVHDSRAAASGSIFVAVKGDRLDGHYFAGKAVENGAETVVCEVSPLIVDPLKKMQNVIRVRDSREALAIIAAELAGNPSSALEVLGVTGTNGKTTVVSLLCHMLYRAGKRALGLTTVGTLTEGGYSREVDLTTPDPVFLQDKLKEALASGIEYVAMEVSSHALAQKRVHSVRYRAGAFTNLTEDHLDYHGSLENYEAAKREFFTDYLYDPAGQTAVIYTDDPAGKRFASLTGAQVIACSLDDENADVHAAALELSPFNSRFIMSVRVSKFPQVSSAWIPHTDRAARTVGIQLPGSFNVANAIVAAALALALGVEPDAVLSGLESFRGVPGRMERIEMGQDFTVLVDYAHTPDALKSVLATLRAVGQKKCRLILVMGNGGDRDKAKRPHCGKIGSEMSDRFYITNDNPRSEDPEAIIAQILAGVEPGERSKVTVITDRREAIKAAISDARPGDCVLIAGKGHEDYQIIGGVKHPFDDRVVASEILSGRYGKPA